MHLCSLLELHKDCWVQQDGAHTMRTTVNMLKEFFRDGDFKGLWPLTSLDFYFFCGEEHLYENSPKCMQQLKENKENATDSIMTENSPEVSCICSEQ
jgi:hypothetical protein